MKYFLCLSLILLCFSQFKCQEIEDNEAFDTEEVEPVTDNVNEDLEEEDALPSDTDTDLIPSFNTPSKGKGKGKKKNTNSDDSDSDTYPGQNPLTSLFSTVGEGAVGIIGGLRERLSSRVQQVGSKLHETQERINKRVQGGITGLMDRINYQIGG